MDGGNMKLLIAAFVVLLVGVSLLTVIASETSNVTETITIHNETLNITSFRNGSIHTNNCNVTATPVQITNYPTGWRTNSEYGCHISGFAMHTANGSVLTNGTDFQFYPNNGTWKCLVANGVFNNTDTTNMTAMNYTYCPSTYLTQGWSRTMVQTVSGFFAIALIAVAIGLFYTVLKREGLMGI